MTETIPKITFRHSEYDLYEDREVILNDSSHESLIQELHHAFGRFQSAGTLRSSDNTTQPDTLYERDYQLTQRHLIGKTWKTMNLQTAGFLIGLQGCLGRTELMAFLPYFFEILLRAESWIWPFDLVFTPFEKRNASDYEAVHADPALRALVHRALVSVRAKYAQDPEFIKTEVGKKLDRRIIEDWA